MHQIVLDTNIYRNDPSRKKLDFQAIEKLSRSSRLMLHIPYIVEREFQTQQSEICNKDLLKTISGLVGLSRKELSEDTLKYVKEIKVSLEESSKNILEDSEKQLLMWAKSIGANRVPLCLDQAEKSMESYFKGAPPLTNIKAREDIPDSFLMRSIEKIAEGMDVLHVIAADKKVINACKNINNLITYKDLKSFIETDFIQNELKQLNPLENLEEVKKGIVSDEEETGDIKEILSYQIGDLIMWKTINDNRIPSDDNEGTISSYGEVEDVEINLSEMTHYGDGKFGIKFNLQMGAYVTYYIFKSEYYAMGDKQYAHSVLDHNDHYFEAEEDFTIRVSGIVSFTIDSESFDVEEVARSISKAKIEIDEISQIELC